MSSRPRLPHPDLPPPFHEGGTTRGLVPVSVSAIKQIAGRAGRRSSQWPNGLATCLNRGDVPTLQEALEVRKGPLPACSARCEPQLDVAAAAGRAMAGSAGVPAPGCHPRSLLPDHACIPLAPRRRCPWPSWPPPRPASSPSLSTSRCLRGSAPTRATGAAGPPGVAGLPTCLRRPPRACARPRLLQQGHSGHTSPPFPCWSPLAFFFRSSLLVEFEKEALLGSRFFFCRQDSVVAAANMLDPVRVMCTLWLCTSCHL